MPSCLGPHLKDQVIPQLAGGMGKFILGLLLTGYFLPLFATSGPLGFGYLDTLASFVVLLIISPIWLGFHRLFGRLINSQVHWSLNVIASSIASAAVAAWLLPGFIIAIFIIIFGFLGNFSS